MDKTLISSENEDSRNWLVLKITVEKLVCEISQKKKINGLFIKKKGIGPPSKDWACPEIMSSVSHFFLKKKKSI